MIDTSGSMQGASIAQAREALELAIHRLSGADRFNVIEFNSYARALYPAARPRRRTTSRRAVRWVRDLRAQRRHRDGEGARPRARRPRDPGRIRQIVFLTDGAVGNEDQLLRMIRERLGDSRLFTVGIGSAPNSHFMTKAAQFGAGTFTYIGRIDEVKEKMDALFAKLESPVLKGVSIDWGGAEGVEAWPKQIPDLYAGEPVMVLFSADTLGESVTVSALAGDRPWQRAGAARCRRGRERAVRAVGARAHRRADGPAARRRARGRDPRSGAEARARAPAGVALHQPGRGRPDAGAQRRGALKSAGIADQPARGLGLRRGVRRAAARRDQPALRPARRRALLLLLAAWLWRRAGA